MSPFCCAQLLPCHSFGGCGGVLVKVVIVGVVAVFVADAVVFFGFDCLVVAFGGG